MLRLLVTLAMLTAIESSASDRLLPAFPGAQGFGAFTPGGRGGRVIQVTNLNDSGPGSLRAACEAEGARVVVFRVGGTIVLKSHLRIDHPFITIAGQTAPGGGILLRDAGLQIRTHDVVVRFLRVRIGESRAQPADSQDALNISGVEHRGGAYNVIVDHCSFSWAIDENVDCYSRAADFTIQWCVISEGLMRSIHHKGPHSMGLLLGPGSTRGSIHHNLFAHNNQRSPRIRGGRRDFVNNVVYNWGSHAAALSDSPEVNFVGNYYRPGPDSSARRPLISAAGDSGGLYLACNLLDGVPWEWDQVEQGSGIARMPRRFHAPLITRMDPADAFHQVLRGAGCRVPARDAVDQRIVREVIDRGGRIIDHPDQVGGFPDIAGGMPLPDRDLDGMPDEWETARGLDPDDPTDASAVPDGGGYTNIEEYINSLVTSPQPNTGAASDHSSGEVRNSSS